MSSQRNPASIIIGLVAISTMASDAVRAAETTLGPFLLEHVLPERGWNEPDPRTVRPALEREGVREPAEFLWISPQRSRIYGSFWEAADVAITTAKILQSAVPAEWYRDWGLREDEVQVRPVILGGAEAVLIEAAGRGNGLWFEKEGDVGTVGIWAIVPVVFEDGNRLRSGIVRLFYRGTEDGSDSGDREAFESLLENVRILPSKKLRTRRDFYVYLGGGEWRGKQDSSSTRLTTTATASLDLQAAGQWSQALQTALADTFRPERIRALEELSAALPGNPFLTAELRRLEAELAEAEAVTTYLANDDDGSRERDLRSLHETILAEIRRRSGIEKAAEYLAYVERVWPQNSLLQPPSDGAGQTERWRHPLLGLEMIHIEPEDGEPFWITTVPIRRSGGAQETVSPSAASWRDALRFAELCGMRPASVSEYRQAASRIAPGGPFWAAGDVPNGKAIQIRIDGSARVTTKRIGRGARAGYGQFLLVLP